MKSSFTDNINQLVCGWRINRTGLIHFDFFPIYWGGVFIVVSIVERWILIEWYREMSEGSWFFWGGSFPYIESPEGREEFVKHRSSAFFILGFIHLVVGVILTPFPEIWFLILIWIFALIPVTLALRADFIDLALGINRKHQLARVHPKKTWPKCRREVWLDLKICPYCGEKLKDQDISVTT